MGDANRRIGRGPLKNLVVKFFPEFSWVFAWWDFSPEKTLLREAKPGGFQTRVFPIFSGKVQLVSRTLSGLFLVGALNRPRARKRTNRENPGPSPSKSGKSQKNRESPKRTKKDKKGRTSPDRETPQFETPPFSGP